MAVNFYCTLYRDVVPTIFLRYFEVKYSSVSYYFLLQPSCACHSHIYDMKKLFIFAHRAKFLEERIFHCFNVYDQIESHYRNSTFDSSVVWENICVCALCVCVCIMWLKEINTRQRLFHTKNIIKSPHCTALRITWNKSVCRGIGGKGRRFVEM